MKRAISHCTVLIGLAHASRRRVKLVLVFAVKSLWINYSHYYFQLLYIEAITFHETLVTPSSASPYT